MANYLPGPDGPGLFEHPLYGESIETHLADNPHGGGFVVRYWNNALCLPQTALYNDTALQWLSELIWAVAPHRILARCILLDCYPSEFLLLRDYLPLEVWSLVISQVRPEVLALCFMSKYDPERYRELVLMSPGFGYGPSGDALSQMVYKQTTDEIDAKVAEYLPILTEKLLESHTGDLKVFQNLSPLRMMWMAENGQLNLRTVFALCQSPAEDVCTLMMSRMHLYTVGFLHMATFAPEEYSRMKVQMGPIVDPIQPGADKPRHEQQMKIMAYALSAYTDGAVANLKNGDDFSFTADEFRALFDA